MKYFIPKHTNYSEIMKIYQKEILLKPRQKGFHLITSEIAGQLTDLVRFKTGMANIFIKHTSAALSINENADPTVRRDFDTFFARLVPEDMKLYEHTEEGPDDMTSHIKNSLFGCSVTIPVKNGKFNLGTWQGIYLCEFREHGGSRNICVTIIGGEYE
jgi:secondary thiamine-phosphate synthase enzyme